MYVALKCGHHVKRFGPNHHHYQIRNEVGSLDIWRSVKPKKTNTDRTSDIEYLFLSGYIISGTFNMPISYQ